MYNRRTKKVEESIHVIFDENILAGNLVQDSNVSPLTENDKEGFQLLEDDVQVPLEGENQVEGETSINSSTAPSSETVEARVTILSQVMNKKTMQVLRGNRSLIRNKQVLKTHKKKVEPVTALEFMDLLRGSWTMCATLGR